MATIFPWCENERSWLFIPCDLSKICSPSPPLFEHVCTHLSFPPFSGSQCPLSLRTASTPFLLRRSTETAAMSLRGMWWPVRAKWGRCAGTTCWCTGSTSRTDICETQTNRNQISVSNMQNKIMTLNPAWNTWNDVCLQLEVRERDVFLHKSVWLQLPASWIYLFFLLRVGCNLYVLYLG